MTASAKDQGEQERTANPAPSNTQIPSEGGTLPSSPSNTLLLQMAEAIYMTHWKEGSPTWENASNHVRLWVDAQAAAALQVVEKYLPAAGY